MGSMAKLEPFVLEQMAKWNVPGVAIGIYDGDDVEFAGFGITNIETGLPRRAGDALPGRIDQQGVHCHIGDDAGR